MSRSHRGTVKGIARQPPPLATSRADAVRQHAQYAWGSSSERLHLIIVLWPAIGLAGGAAMSFQAWSRT